MTINEIKAIVPFGGNSVEIPSTYEVVLRKPNKDGNSTILVEDSNAAALLFCTDSMVEANEKNDLAICKAFAAMKRDNTFKKVGLKNVSEYAALRFGWETSTANTYTNIGTTFFNADGSEKIARIGEFSKGALIPLCGLVNDYPTICGVQWNNDIMAALVANNDISPLMTVAEIKSIVKELKASYIPKAWCAIKDIGENGEWTYCLAAMPEIEFDDCPYLEEEAKPSKSSKNASKTDESGADDENTANANLKPSEAILGAWEAIKQFPLSDTLKKEMETFEKKLVSILAKVDKETEN